MRYDIHMGFGTISRVGLSACALVYALLFTGCVKQDNATRIDASKRAELQAAIAALEVDRDTTPPASYGRAWNVIGAASEPHLVREIAAHFEDSRATILLESLQRPDGGPSVYTIGDALFFHMRRRFFTQQTYMLTGRNCPDYFGDKASFTQWLTRHDFDVSALRAAYQRDMSK